MTGVENRAGLAPIWQRRFEFYDRYSQFGSTDARAALQKLPFFTRIRIRRNFLALLFGPMFYVAKGMWRKGLVLVAAGVVVGVMLHVVGIADDWVQLTGIAFFVAQELTANYAYYLHRVRHSRSWNPFEGFTHN